MFGAGMIKMRADPCWRDLTCLFYHYETQPLPNPLSWYLHHSPRWMHKTGVLFTHFAQLVVPWFYFAPAPNMVRKSTHTVNHITAVGGRVSDEPRKIARKPVSASIVSQPKP